MKPAPLILVLFGVAELMLAQQDTAKIGVLVEQRSALTGIFDKSTTSNASIGDILDMSLTLARINRLTGRVNIVPVYENGVTFLNLYEKACQLLSQGVVALVAPSAPSMAPLVAAIGTKYGILTVLPASLSGDLVSSNELLNTQSSLSPIVPNRPPIIHSDPQSSPRVVSDSTSIVIRPRQEFVAEAVEDYIITEKWDSFTIIYEDPNALAYLQRLLHLGRPRVSDFYLEQVAEHSSSATSSSPTPKSMKGLPRGQQQSSTTTYHVYLRQLRPAIPGSNDYRPLLKDLRESGVSRFVVDCQASSIDSFLQQALQVNMLNVYFHYFFTSLDANLVDYGAYWYGGANLTYLQLSNQSANVRGIEDRLVRYAVPNSLVPASASYPNRPIYSNPMTNSKRSWTASDMFLFDGVLSLANAIGNLSRIQKLDSSPVTCDSQSVSQYKAVGDNLLNYMRTTVDLTGITGQINIDERGWRTSVALDVAQINKRDGKAERYAEWLPNSGGIRVVAAWQQTRKDSETFFQNKTLVVTTIVEEPFVMFRTPKGGQVLEGNARYEGFCVDLMEKLSEDLHFKYQLKLVDDGKYGAPVDPSQLRWNGMVGELLSKKADIAIAPLTITFIREQVIDFTTPYMNLGISILYRKPKQEPPTLFSFMNPLEPRVWYYVLGAYVATSIILYIVARVTPYEWVRKPACQHERNPTTMENQFTLFNSLWFTISSLMQQGCDIAPRAFSTRIIGSVWSFFTLIIISSYTANLAAFLTIERLQTDITSAEDLAKQSDIKYGTRSSGSTMTFFKNSKIPTYEKMWNYMSTAQPTVFVNSSAEGIMKVRAGDYAYLMESIMIEYQVQRDCDLMMVGGLLDSKGYGIGLPRGSPLREDISNAILKLQEGQFLQMLKMRWWVEKSKKKGGERCGASEVSKTATSQLGISQVGGVFACLVIGLAVGILLSVFEFCFRIKKRQSRMPPGISFGRYMLDQCRLILHFKSESAPTQRTSKVAEPPARISPPKTMEPQQDYHHQIMPLLTSQRQQTPTAIAVEEDIVAISTGPYRPAPYQRGHKGKQSPVSSKGLADIKFNAHSLGPTPSTSQQHQHRPAATSLRNQNRDQIGWRM